MYRIIGADGREYGPITAAQLLEWITEGRANSLTRAKAEGTDRWKPLTEYVEFAAALGRVPPPLTAPKPVCIRPAPRTNAMALASLAMGILSMSCCCCGVPFSVLGIIFALVALAQTRDDSISQQGKGLAIAGLALSLLGFVMSVFGFLLGPLLSAPDIMREIKRL